MGSISKQTNLATRQSARIAVVCLMTFLFMAGLIQKLTAQCVEHQDKTTALKFSNESSFELTFFVDDDEEGILVQSWTISEEIGVKPGGHLLRARAIAGGKSFWVGVINKVPKGQVCTWTITDPPEEPVAVRNQYRTTIRMESKRGLE